MMFVWIILHFAGLITLILVDPAHKNPRRK